MPLTGYPVLCYHPICGKPAVFKIAARWSDDVTQELKTYALSCPDCLGMHFRRSLAKQAACHLAPGETLDLPGIYELARGSRNLQLVRRFDLEEQLAAPPSSSPP